MYDSCVVAGQLHNMLNDLKRWWCMKANSIVVFHWVLNCSDYNVSAVCEQTGCLLCLGSGWLKYPSLLGAEELLCHSSLLPCGSSQHPASADPTVAPGDEVRAPCATHIQSDWVRKNRLCAWDPVLISCSLRLVLPHLGHLLPRSVCAVSEITLAKAWIII